MDPRTGTGAVGVRAATVCCPSVKFVEALVGLMILGAATDGTSDSFAAKTVRAAGARTASVRIVEAVMFLVTPRVATNGKSDLYPLTASSRAIVLSLEGVECRKSPLAPRGT
jgi:hypothetical protein